MACWYFPILAALISTLTSTGRSLPHQHKHYPSRIIKTIVSFTCSFQPSSIDTPMYVTEWQFLIGLLRWFAHFLLPSHGVVFCFFIGLPASARVSFEKARAFPSKALPNWLSRAWSSQFSLSSMTDVNEMNLSARHLFNSEFSCSSA